MGECLDTHLVVFFSMLHQRMLCHSQHRPRPTLPLQLALFLMNGLHICPFEGETPAERMMLRRETQEASAEQAAQELLAD